MLMRAVTSLLWHSSQLHIGNSLVLCASQSVCLRARKNWTPFSLFAQMVPARISIPLTSQLALAQMVERETVVFRMLLSLGHWFNSGRRDLLLTFSSFKTSPVICFFDDCCQLLTKIWGFLRIDQPINHWDREKSKIVFLSSLLVFCSPSNNRHTQFCNQIWFLTSVAFPR